MVKSHKFSVIDGHIDTATKLHEQKRKFCEYSTTGQFDLPRMKEGNVQVALFAIFPASTQNFIIKNLDTWFKMVSDPANGLMQVKSINDFNKIEKDKKRGGNTSF
ncbi:unnamed protein product [marine sediment metagenome]|uniref:Uncharacterized protein n=1 Tax=marine sediment metagenome TaxID=412755 RepID=X1RFA5_9ZZZZ